MQPDVEFFEACGTDGARLVGVLRPRRGGRRTSALVDLLRDASTRLMSSCGGHLPDAVVTDFVQANYTSVHSICDTFANTGHRLCMFEADGRLVSTVLVSRSPATALVVDSSHINVPIATAALPARWHQIFNFTTAFDSRRNGLGRRLLDWLLMHPDRLGLSGDGVWTYVEPPDRAVYVGLGFSHLSSGDLYLHLPGTDNSEYNSRYLEGIAAQRIGMPDLKLKCFLMTRAWSPTAAL